MTTVLVLIACSEKKLSHASPAAELYTGQLFRLSRRYAEHLGGAWRILSAKYGVVDPRQIIEPYDRTLRGKGRDEVRQWAAWCQCDLIHAMAELGCEETRGDYLDFPRVIILAGKDYVQPLLRWTMLSHYRDRVETPLAGLGIGKQLAFLSQAVREVNRSCVANRAQQSLFSFAV
jgi:hypothetical protein